MSEYRWANDLSMQFLSRGYLQEGETLDQRVDIICDNAERILNIEGFAKRFKENFKKGWYSLSSPVWSNFGNDRGLPISCFGSHLEDTMESILFNVAEVGMMTKYGGGTSAYFGKLRPRGAPIKDNGESSGPVHFMQMFDKLINVISQGSVRRGNFAAYLDIDHPDIEEFLSIRSEGHPIQDLLFGVNVPDYWLNEMIAGDPPKRKIWAKVLEARTNFGLPYIQFTDNVNNNSPAPYKHWNRKINGSNLCSEIQLAADEDESFVCCLSSMNILHFDEWKDTDAVELLVYFLDAVMTEFITKSEHILYMERARRFAINQRALGIGWLGYHSYLQSKMIPFESFEAKMFNNIIASTIKKQADQASEKMCDLYGQSYWLLSSGSKKRHTTLQAIAPTKSSAFILGQVSEGIEPHRTNYYIKDLAKGKFSIRNPYLVDLLEKIGKNDEDTWKSILEKSGSVQHLEFLDQETRDVFKTFAEISQMEVVIQAASRQKYVDQGQSLNLMIHPSIPTKDVNKLILEGWKLGVKAFYYQFSVNAAQTFARDILACSSCEA